MIFHRLHVALFASLLLTACSVEPLPADEESETSGYWNQAEVDMACESWAEAQTACAAGGPAVEELADSCRESVMVDNPAESASCHDAQLEQYSCVGGLSCDELAAYADGLGDYPCKTQVEAAGSAC
jgi:hypothetical protein